MKNNKMMIYSFISGIAVILIAIIFAGIFPGVKLNSFMKIALYIVLVVPWVVFIFAILIPQKDNH